MTMGLKTNLAVRTHALEQELAGDVMEAMRTNQQFVCQFVGMEELFSRMNAMMEIHMIKKDVLTIAQVS